MYNEYRLKKGVWKKEEKEKKGGENTRKIKKQVISNFLLLWRRISSTPSYSSFGVFSLSFEV
jgi:hypothetical protein